MKFGAIIISSLLSLLVLSNSLTISLTYAHYELDPIGFIKTYCINIDQPELECDGKCQLKKVTKNNSEDSSLPTSIIDFEELVMIFNTTSLYTLKVQQPKSKLHIFYKNHYEYLSYSDCFHPPRV